MRFSSLPFPLLFFLTILILSPKTVYAQRAYFSGQVRDSVQRSPLESATVMLVFLDDTTEVQGLITDTQGRFAFKKLKAGAYRVRVSYVGYKEIELKISLPDGPITPVTFDLQEEDLTLDAVEIVGKTPPVTQKGDTTQFNANAFKTQPDATTEDLLRKMPGVTIEGGQVKAQGEKVQRVLVDGKPFFGDDPNVAIRNLPAGSVESIQVFDQLSEQAQFTGLDDGNTTKTLNIVLRPTYREGGFGRAQAGAGTDERYQASASHNQFKGARRLSFLGQSNNINQQNFSSEDLSGAFGSSTAERRYGRRANLSANVGDFLVNEQGGISRTTAGGFSLTDSSGKRLQFTTGYLFNQTDNEQEVLSRRQSFTGGQLGQFTDANSQVKRLNSNHRIQFRGNYTLDSMNSFLLTPEFKIQDVSANVFNSSQTFDPEGKQLNTSRSKATDDRIAFDYNVEFLWRHKFRKLGRTFSMEMDASGEGRNNETSLSGLNVFTTNFAAETDTLEQRGEGNLPSTRLEMELEYTEPLSDKSQLDFRYEPVIRFEESEQTVRHFDSETQSYSLLDSLLSNTYTNRIDEQVGRIGYRYSDKKWVLYTRLEARYVVQTGQRAFPTNTELRRDFFNVLPGFFMRYSPKRGTSLRMWGRLRANPPRVADLQDVVNNSNPIQLKSGNPNLRQDYENNVGLRFSSTTSKYQTWSAFFNARYTLDYIGNESWIAQNEPLVIDNVTLERGQQLSRPANLDNFMSVETEGSWSRPLESIKMNLNLSLGVSYSQTPSRINNITNQTQNGRTSTGITLSSNIGPELDYTIGYRGAYNFVENTTRPELNNNFYSHTLEARTTWTFWKGMYIQGQLTQIQYSGLEQGIAPDFWLMNGALGYRFLRNKVADVNISVFDAFNQNNSISRTVGDTYVEDTQTLVLRQYFLLNFSYRLLPKAQRKPVQAEEIPGVE